MKILMLGSMPNPDYPSKGVFNQRAANSIGERVDLVVVSIRSWKPGRKLKEVENYENYTLIRLSIPHKPAANGFFHYLNQKIWIIFILFLTGKQISNCDLVHSVSGSYGFAGAGVASRLKVPHVLQLTGSDVNSEYPQLLGSSQVKSLLKHTQAVVGNSRRLVIDFQNLFSSSFESAVIYRGVDLEAFRAEQATESSNRFLYLGGLDAYPYYSHGMNTKGGLTLMKAWKRSESKLKELKAELSFGGPSTPNTQFDEWIASLKHPELVKSCGVLSSESVKEAYKVSQFVIIPSMEEGLPNVAVEASAKGRILIGSDTGGIPEVIENNSSGFIFSAGNEEELAKMLIRACELGYPERAEMSRKARMHVESQFDHSRFGEDYQKLYQKLCAE